MKTVILILYMPGYGGNFLNLLLSTLLGASSIIKAKPFTPLITDSAHDAWKTHHNSCRQFDVEKDVFESYLKSSLMLSDKFLLPVHPYEFYRYVTLNSDSCYSVKYLQISLDPKLEYVIDQFKIDNHNFPIRRDVEGALNEQFTKVYNPYIINLDNFFYGEETFLEEFLKLTAHLDTTPNIDLTLPLYRDWYLARKLGRYNLVPRQGFEP